jgi:hypothetical protein
MRSPGRGRLTLPANPRWGDLCREGRPYSIIRYYFLSEGMESSKVCAHVYGRARLILDGTMRPLLEVLDLRKPRSLVACLGARMVVGGRYFHCPDVLIRVFS